MRSAVSCMGGVRSPYAVTLRDHISALLPHHNTIPCLSSTGNIPPGAEHITYNVCLALPVLPEYTENHRQTAGTRGGTP
ncbi:MAG: hypothetical protein D3906_11850 [Candidatus Electrothrix sp. AUS1_2]|nr:hypothetical protein [Candidatus Electrothrix sp. AUS1_2]